MYPNLSLLLYEKAEAVTHPNIIISNPWAQTAAVASGSAMAAYADATYQGIAIREGCWRVGR